MKCPYCGSNELLVFEDATFCNACGAEFEPGEIEYNQGQGDDEEDQLISLNAITQLIDKEIEWCKNDQDQAPGDSAVWFIKGLEQAKYLILEASKINDFHDPLPNDDLPKNRPGYMGDYGGIPHGPFDV